jgi:hypothetical protein
MSKAEAQFRKLTTPATEHTREIGFVVAVDEDVNEWIGSSTMPVRGDTYASTPIEPKPYVAKLDASGVAYGTYILTRVTDSGGRFYFYFSKGKTDAAAAIPFKDPEEWMGNHYWPPILLEVDIARSRMKRAVNTGDATYRGSIYTATPTFIPSADTGTLFRLYESLWPSRPNIEQHMTPLAGAVHFPLPGSPPFRFGECLHGGIEVDQLIDSEDIIATVGSAITSNLGVYSRASFPATNFKTWLPYVLSDKATKIATGAYHRFQIEAIPPFLPRRVRG